MHSALRQATTDIHARIDALVSGGFDDDASGYRCYLQGMHAFMGAATAALPDRQDWAELRSALDADLQAVDAQPLPPPAMAPVAGAAARTGWEYVVSGAALGARVLLRDAHRLGWDATHGAAFLTRHAEQGAQWPALLQHWAALPAATDPTFVAAACDAARTAFHHAEAALTAACQES